MKTKLEILLLFFAITLVSAQNIFAQQKDSTDDKMKSYMMLIEKADVYEQKAESEISKTNIYKLEARKLLDSAYVAAKQAELDKTHSKIYTMQYNLLYKLAESYTKKADSSYTIALKYKDTANIRNKEAEAYYLKIAEEHVLVGNKDDIKSVVDSNDVKPVVENNEVKPVVSSDLIKPEIFVVQIGAGKMDADYFDKVKDVRVVKPKDGIRRYIVGAPMSKEAAIELRDKMVKLGYKDSFIRTLDSLK